VLICVNAVRVEVYIDNPWRQFTRYPENGCPIAPSDCDLEVCVIDRQGVHALLFPCRKNGPKWIDPSTKKVIDIRPSHWRIWTEGS